MNQNEVKIKSPIPECWHSEEDKNIILFTPNDVVITTQKVILQPYLKKIKENIASHELDEQRKDKLRASYKTALDKAKILMTKEDDLLKKKPTDDVLLNDKRYYETDAEGKTYVSDDT